MNGLLENTESVVTSTEARGRVHTIIWNLSRALPPITEKLVSCLYSEHYDSFDWYCISHSLFKYARHNPTLRYPTNLVATRNMGTPFRPLSPHDGKKISSKAVNNLRLKVGANSIARLPSKRELSLDTKDTPDFKRTKFEPDRKIVVAVDLYAKSRLSRFI